MIKLFSAWYGLLQIKRFSKRTQSDKFLKDKAFKIASDPKYDAHQKGLASMVYKFFDKNAIRLKNPVEVVLLINQIIN